MEVLAVIKSVSQTMSKTNDDGSVSTRKIVSFTIGDKEFHVTVFRGLDRYQQGQVGMLGYSVSSEVRTAMSSGEPYVSYKVTIDSWRPYNQQAVVPAGHPSEPTVPQSADAEGKPFPSQSEVTEVMAEAAEVAESHIDPETGLPF